MSEDDGWDYVPNLGALVDGHVTATRRSDSTQVESRWKPLGGRAEPVELTVRPALGRAVSTDEIRRLPLGTVLAGSRAALLDTAQLAHEAAAVWTNVPDVNETFLRVGPQRGRRLDDELLREVARIYREAWAMGRPVNDAVREAFNGGLSKDGAAKRIMAARRAGLLEGVGRKR